MSRLLRIALRNVRRNTRRSLITLLSVFVGVALVAVLKGFINGYIDLQVREVVEGKTGALQVHRAGYLDNLEGAPLELSMPTSPELLAKIKSVPGVVAVTGRIQFNGFANNGLSQAMYMARGLDLATEKLALPRTGWDVLPGGRPLREDDLYVVLVGEELANSFNAVTNAELINASVRDGVPPTTDLTINSTSPEGRANSLTVHVVGKINSGLPFADKRIITVPLRLAQELLNMKGKVTEYAIAVDRLDHLESIASNLRSTLGPEYEVSTWVDLQPDTRDRLKRLSVMLAAITAILLIMALTGIMNTMLMSVYERVREIGTMLAVGVRRSQVLWLFLVEAITLGALGGFGGALVGRLIVAAINVNGIPIPSSGTAEPGRIRLILPLPYLTGAVIVAAGAAMLAALYPARKASKLNPVDALRSV